MDTRGGWRGAALLLAGGLFFGCGDDGRECSSFDPCGGDPVGEWNIDDLCVETGNLMVPGCEDARLDFSGVRASGTMRFDEGGAFSGEIQLSGTGRVVLPTSCLPEGATCDQLRNEDISCLTSGGSCVCTAQFEEQMGSGAGTWEVSGSSITFASEDNEPNTGEFCADRDELQIHFEDDALSGTYFMSRT
jgi:hypothetical protein